MAEANKPWPVDRAALDATRRRCHRAVPDAKAWTACTAPAEELVIDADGAIRACEYGAAAVAAPGAADLGAAWHNAAIRRELAGGKLPLPHCHGCALWLTHDLVPHVPLLRADLTAAAGDGPPRRLVLRLPPAKRPWSPPLVDQALALVATAESVVVEAERLFSHPLLAPLLAAVKGTAKPPALELRTHALGAVDRIARQFAGVHVASLELTATTRQVDAAKQAQLAKRLGCTARVRFVLGPGNWFDFEATAQAAAAAGLLVDFVTLDRDGRVPLLDLATDELAVVKDAVVAAYPRCGVATRPSSISEHAFDHLCSELRALLRDSGEAALRARAAKATTSLALPPIEHPWYTDPALQSWWLPKVFGQALLPAFADWVVATATSRGGGQTLAARPWFRVLSQRIARDLHPPSLLAALRDAYAPARQQLAGSDDAFAAGFDLRPFGGPWAAALGLTPAAPRTRPFPIGRALRPAKRASADVTVLVPSFRHEAYIEETLRSVLAQTYSSFKLLVIDDQSPDATVARARAVDDPRLEIVVNPANVGLGNSVLAALDRIDTPYVALLNSDDLFHPERLQRCREALAANEQAQLVTTGLSLIDHDGGELTPSNTSLLLDGRLVHDWVAWYASAKPPANLTPDELFGALLERNFLATSTNFVARTDWLRAQAESLRSLKYCLDWQLFLEAALTGVLVHLPEPLAAYRLHATNTVWFREGRRWSYYLEVNRVVSHALRRFASVGPARRDAMSLRVLEAVSHHATKNRETDGFALFLHTALEAIELDRLATTSPRARALVEELNATAERVRGALDLAAQQRRDDGPQRHLRTMLGDLAEEQLRVERSSRRWLQGYVDSLEARLREAYGQVDRLVGEKDGLLRQKGEADKRVADLQAEAQRLSAAAKTERERAGGLDGRAQQLQRDLDGVRGDLATARGAAAAIAELRDLVARELAASRSERDSAMQERDRLQATMAGEARKAREQADAEAAKLREELATLHRIREEVVARRDALGKEREELVRQRDAAATERTALAKENEFLIRERNVLTDERNRLADDHGAATRQRDELSSACEAFARDKNELTRRRDELTAERDVLVRDRSELTRERDALVKDKVDLTQRRDALAAERDALVKDKAELTQRRDALAAEKARLAQERDALAKQHRETTEALAKEKSQVQTLTQAKKDLESARQSLVHDLGRTREEMDKLVRSREFRSGNFLWNKMPLAYLSRRGKKWYRRFVDAKDRALSVLRRPRRAEGVAIVAACWQWPIYSHTFVYQEMIGLTHMGLDVRMFHWDLGDTGQLHKAFAYLADHRTQLQPLGPQHKKDKEHFEKTKPGRLRAFLELVAQRTGRKVEDLEKDSLVLQGCTFARMAELAGAKYLHSYFFYDQSFMAMQAAWLLGVPRGISCYADHMLDDYPFKLVGLHVELADVIVATSARIKRELSAKSAGKFDDKIIVKPNGVDGARFPAIQRPERQPGDPIEAVSISRIEPKKGLTHLVEAVADLKRRGHRLVVHVIGSKDPHSKGSLEYAADFERRISELGVADQIVLHGMKKQEDLAPILRQCRAFVAPYVEVENGDKDGIPTAMLEGLASSLPVITTNSGSILEVVTDQVEGLVVPQRDSKALADAFERLIREPVLERRLAKAARARFDREFDIQVTEKRLHERVARLVGRAAKTP
jgi:colanic acid/amylovoran biosynthesis glycosyltransferase